MSGCAPSRAATRDAGPADAEPLAVSVDAGAEAATIATAAVAPSIGPLPALEVQEVEATGLLPKGAVLSNDGKTLYVTNFGQLDGKRVVSIYDAETLAPLGQLDIPHVVVEGVLSADDKTLYLSSFWGHSVVFVDLATKTIVHEVKTPYHPKTLALSRDGSSLFAANWSGETITQVDVASATVVRTLKVGKNPRGLVVTARGVLYAANFFDESIDVFEGSSFERKHRVATCKCPRHLALSPDEKTLYISCLYASQLHAFDLATETVTHRVRLGGDSPKSIAVSRDGRYVYSADYGTTRSVSVVDTKDWTTRTLTVPGMDRGSGIAVAANGHHAYVTGWYDSHVYLVGFEGAGGHPSEAKKKTSAWLRKPFSRDPGDAPDASAP